MGRFRCGFREIRHSLNSTLHHPPLSLFLTSFPHFHFVSAVNIFDKGTKHVPVASSAGPRQILLACPSHLFFLEREKLKMTIFYFFYFLFWAKKIIITNILRGPITKCRNIIYPHLLRGHRFVEAQVTLATVPSPSPSSVWWALPVGYVIK